MSEQPFEAAYNTEQTPANHVPSADTGSMPLLQDLVRELYSECVRLWESIGIILGIKVDVLVKIKSDHASSGDAACLREMLKIWLNNSPHPSWSVIADAIEALGDPYIQLVNRLRAKYCHTQLTQRNHEVLLQQLSDGADRWRDIGSHLCFTQSELDEISKTNQRSDQPIHSLSEMLWQWLG